MDSKFVAPYTEEKLAADLEAGTVDSTALKEMVGVNDHLMKMTLQAVSKYGAGKAQIAENQKTVIDWEHWEAAIDDPVVGELKGVYEQLLKEAEGKIVPAYEKDQQDVLAKLNEQFEGLISEGRKAEAASKAGMEQTITDLKALEGSMTGLKEQTIAEVLEADPEMRKEIEEEMKNHQWGV